MMRSLLVLALASLVQPSAVRTIAIDERLAADAGLHVGDRVVVAGKAGIPGDTVVVAAITGPPPDPADVARGEYHVRLHLDHLQRLVGYENRVDRFAVGTRGPAATTRALAAIDRAAFGFRAYRSADVAAGTSRTFEVVRRFHRAIGVITIVASAIFLLCILLLKVDERRRDVAALRLIGLSRRTVVLALVLEAALVSLLGTALGVGVGWLGTLFINVHYRAVYRTPLTFAALTPDVIALSAALALGLGVVAGFLAARRLARTPPLSLFGR
ncbi:ABC transporter permease [Gemmatirosa kalamazoonensis]|nr:ABC transporter permease [Gemmatirosa kalamazoonensis]